MFLCIHKPERRASVSFLTMFGHSLIVRSGRLALLSAALCGGASGVLVGCESSAKSAPLAGAAPTTSKLPTTNPDAGVQSSMVLSTLDGPNLARALLPYADQPTPLSRELVELYAAHGLRVLSVPIGDVPQLVQTLQPAAPAQSQWLGQAFTWTEITRGIEHAQPTTIALDSERVRLPAGALRLLLRSWLEPAPPTRGGVGTVAKAGDDVAAGPPTAILRTELVPQHDERLTRSERDEPLSLTPPSIAPESRGLMFRRLYAQFVLPPGRALLIVPERPGVTWRDLALIAPDPVPAAPETAQTQRIPSDSGPTENPWAGVAPRSDSAIAKVDNPWAKKDASPEANPEANPGASTEPSKPKPSAAKVVPDAGEPITNTDNPWAQTPRRPGPADVSPGAPGLGQVKRTPRTGRTSDAPATATTPVEAGGADAAPAGPIGPVAPRVLSLGEAMMTAQPPARQKAVLTPAGSAPASPRWPIARSIIVLVPQIPAEFSLSR